jgi:hypothetical protein
MAAFFARLRIKHGAGQYRRVWYVERSGELTHAMTKKPVTPKLLGGEVVADSGIADRREALARWITTPGDSQFALATVNRIWAEYFGAGIVEPFDDFRSTNPPSNPELLEQLARFFADSGYRFKALHRVILNSRDPLEKVLFARYETRKLTAEVLLDAIVRVTGVPHKFRGYPAGTSPKDLVLTNSPEYFLTTFGMPRRDILCERARTPSLGQALHLMNSAGIEEKIRAEGNVIGELLARGAGDDSVLEILYERAYARPPSERARRSFQEYCAESERLNLSRRRILENTLWAILNSKEFQVNR